MKTLYAFALAVFCSTNTATAQDFPNKTIRFIVPYSAGGGTDSVARLTGAYMSTALGQQVVVENKPGASANIGTEAVGVDGLGGLSDLINTGKLKALAVLTPKRSPLAPNIPSLGDIGINDVDGNGWYGALVPASTPPAIVARLNAAFSAALEAPEIRERLIAMGVEPVGGSSQDFLAYLVGERAKWAKVISTGKIKAE